MVNAIANAVVAAVSIAVANAVDVLAAVDASAVAVQHFFLAALLHFRLRLRSMRLINTPE